jgi:hypothetical protein
MSQYVVLEGLNERKVVHNPYGNGIARVSLEDEYLGRKWFIVEPAPNRFKLYYMDIYADQMGTWYGRNINDVSSICTYDVFGHIFDTPEEANVWARKKHGVQITDRKIPRSWPTLIAVRYT